MRTTGVVDDIEKVHMGEGYFDFTIYYSFEVRGKEYHGKEINSEKIHTNPYKKGDRIYIVFEKSNPSKNFIYAIIRE